RMRAGARAPRERIVDILAVLIRRRRADKCDGSRTRQERHVARMVDDSAAVDGRADEERSVFELNAGYVPASAEQEDGRSDSRIAFSHFSTFFAAVVSRSGLR